MSNCISCNRKSFCPNCDGWKLIDGYGYLCLGCESDFVKGSDKEIVEEVFNGSNQEKVD